MKTTHRAMVWANGKLSVLERPTPKPDGHEVLVAPLYAGLCGTDIQILRGLRFDSSPVIGHEGVARVVAAGRDAPEQPALNQGGAKL